jgi:aminoglycoside phosphotransferase (APT) family kinase protein
MRGDALLTAGAAHHCRCYADRRMAGPAATQDVEAMVRRIVRDALGGDVHALEHMTFGHSSRVYDVTLAGDEHRHVIVRLNPNPEVFSGTEPTLDALRALGLPVPRLLTLDRSLSRHTMTYTILDKIPGRDLRYELAAMTSDQMTEVAAQVVAIERAVATLPPGAGYGFVPIGTRGRASTWETVVTRYVRSSARRLGTALPDDVTVTLREAMVRHAGYLDAVPPTCFLDDLTTKNVIVECGELRGIVDLDVVCYGDPLFWLGLTQTAVTCDDVVGDRAPFYVAELCRLWGVALHEQAIVDLYAAVHALDFAASSHEDGEARERDSILDRARGWLTSSS